MKASDLDDVEVILAIESARGDGMWAMRGEIENQFPEYPWKVITAKLRSMKRRGLVQGCPCGCRGDWYPLQAGLDLCNEP